MNVPYTLVDFLEGALFGRFMARREGENDVDVVVGPCLDVDDSIPAGTVCRVVLPSSSSCS
jgi:hypothetical protein